MTKARLISAAATRGKASRSAFRRSRRKGLRDSTNERQANTRESPGRERKFSNRFNLTAFQMEKLIEALGGRVPSEPARLPLVLDQLLSATCDGAA